MLSLPSFYYPTTTVWVDDDDLFLNTISNTIGLQHLKTFNNPNDCISFFDTYTQPLKKASFLRGAIEDERYDLVNHAPVDLNVSTLHQIHHSPERFTEISVIIVDDKMPEIRGIELCKKLYSHPSKKILLTGEATHAEAIAAFNDNTIDRFIRKDSSTLEADIKRYINDLSHQYFQEDTKTIISHLEAEYKLPLSDIAFKNFFHELCTVNAIKEYYLIDKTGSLMLVSDTNELSYLIIHTDRSLDAFTELHNDMRDNTPYINMITQRNKIPFFGVGKESWQFEITEWPQHLFATKILDGRERYYYSLIK